METYRNHIQIAKPVDKSEFQTDWPCVYLVYMHGYTALLYRDYKPFKGSLWTNEYNGMSKGFWTLLNWPRGSSHWEVNFLESFLRKKHDVASASPLGKKPQRRNGELWGKLGSNVQTNRFSRV